MCEKSHSSWSESFGYQRDHGHANPGLPGFQQGKVEVHSPTGPGRHPPKPQVGEMVRRLHVQFRHPAVGEKPHNPRKTDQPEGDAEQRSRRTLNRRSSGQSRLFRKPVRDGRCSNRASFGMNHNSGMLMTENHLTARKIVQGVPHIFGKLVTRVSIVAISCTLRLSLPVLKSGGRL